VEDGKAGPEPATDEEEEVAAAAEEGTAAAAAAAARDEDAAAGGKREGKKKVKKEKKEKKEKKDKDKKEKSHKHKLKIGAGKVPGKIVKKGSKVTVLKKKGLLARQKAKQKQKEQEFKKVLTKSEDDYEPVNQWWSVEGGADTGKRGSKKWDTFEHHGLMFVDPYTTPHKVPLIYDGVEMELPLEAEEVANYWVAVKGSEYETKEKFIENFWKAFKEKLPKNSPIKEFAKCDFTKIWEHREQERNRRLSRSKEEKEEAKQKEQEASAWYSHALVNGIKEKLGSVKLEPPSLFRGRGEHPKQGMLKKMTLPEQVCLNMSECACVPKVSGMPGHAWRDILHENCVQWMAFFDDSITGETKYVGFAANSSFKGQPDLLKYERAKRLISKIGSIRASYEKLQKSKAVIDKQKATATYFIDKLALRVGGEKDTEEEADTVGCCSLRCEHIKLEEPDIVHFDFLGKDSIRYQNTVTVTTQVFGNIKSFMANKKPTEQIFDKVIPATLNEYFKEFMDDLSAKVFRTYNASYTLQQELDKFNFAQKDGYSQDDLVKFYTDANRQVAILCNHQKAVSKQHGAAMDKMKEKKEEMEAEIKRVRKHMKKLKEHEGKILPIKPEWAGKLPKDEAACQKKIAELNVRLSKLSSTMAMKEDNKTVALGTSKMSYMDPRITVAWCKKVDLAIEKVFPRTVLSKFPWAMHFSSQYSFKAA